MSAQQKHCVMPLWSTVTGILCRKNIQISGENKNFHFVSIFSTQKGEDFSMELYISKKNLIFSQAGLLIYLERAKHLLDVFCLCTLLQMTGLLLHFSASAFLPVKQSRKWKSSLWNWLIISTILSNMHVYSNENQALFEGLHQINQEESFLCINLTLRYCKRVFYTP